MSTPVAIKGTTSRLVGSDKTPMKRSLLCRTCSERTPGTSVYVAYGIAEKLEDGQQSSFGQWRHAVRDREHEELEPEEL